MREKGSSAFHQDMNLRLRDGIYVEGYTRKGTVGIARLLAGVCRLRGIIKKMEKVRCLVCLGKEVKHILLKCSEMGKRRKEFLSTE